jgi:hypothetical protein
MFEQAPMTKFVTIDEAELYTMTLTYNNHYDWRLPTMMELRHATPDISKRPVCWHQHDLVGNLFDMKCALIPVRTL